MWKKTLINLLPCILLSSFAFGQDRNVVDANGWKQGVHDGSSGSWQFERTYRNDTLNGYFRKYVKYGNTLSSGYYKNGLMDSVWLDFEFDGTLKKKEYYSEGRKNGEIIHYYKNGDISYMATFMNDTLVGDAVNYYPGGVIKSKGDPYNGRWEEYDEDGSLQSAQYFRNKKMIERFYFSPEGNVLLPCSIPQQLVTNDTSIINNTDLKVYLLFETPDRKAKSRYSPLFLMDGIVVCENEMLTIHIGPISNFVISSDGVSVYEQADTVCVNTIKTTGYRTSLRVKERANGEYKEWYETGKTYFSSDVGKIEVETTDQGCQDTGVNPVTITHNNQTLYFKDIGNLIFFEYDIDRDGQNELYILNYFTCEGHLEIYKVDTK